MRNFRETLNLLSAVGMAVRNGAVAVARQVAPWTPFVQQQVAQHVAAEVQHQAVLQVERHASQILWDVSVATLSCMFQNPGLTFFGLFTGITGTTMDFIVVFKDIVMIFKYFVVITKMMKDDLGISVYQLVVFCFILAIVILVLIIVNIIGQSRIFKGFVFLYNYVNNDESNETNETEQPEPEKTTKKGARLMSPRRK
jgi:hypothetical protein